MALKTKAVLLVNLGTPDKAELTEVRRFLFQFLNDRRVIDLPWILQKILVNLVIVPFRAPKSTLLYKRLWTKDGSPILYYLEQLIIKLQKVLGNRFHVYGAMRYGNPSLKKTLLEINRLSYDELIVVPLFPQYASSITGTVMAYVMSEIKKWEVIPGLRFIEQFYNHPAFLDAFEHQIRQAHPEDFDHILFSYHGLPLRHLDKIHPTIESAHCSCPQQMPAHGKHCYKATCYETTRLLADRLNLPKKSYSVAFQSRLSNNWLQPFTDEHIRELAGQGIKKLLVVVPSFVSDCLESKVEISFEYHDLFKRLGGTDLVLVDSLNDSDLWVKGLAEMIG